MTQGTWLPTITWAGGHPKTCSTAVSSVTCTATHDSPRSATRVVLCNTCEGLTASRRWSLLILVSSMLTIWLSAVQVGNEDDDKEEDDDGAAADQAAGRRSMHSGATAAGQTTDAGPGSRQKLRRRTWLSYAEPAHEDDDDGAVAGGASASSDGGEM